MHRDSDPLSATRMESAYYFECVEDETALETAVAGLGGGLELGDG